MRRSTMNKNEVSPGFGRLLEAAALSVLVLAALILPLGQADRALPFVSAWDIAVGESLAHGISAPDVNSATTSMPLSTSWAAAQFGHLGWREARLGWLALCVLLLLTAAALACELGPWPAGPLVILMLACVSDGWLSLTNMLHASYALLVLHAAWALARFAREPSAASGAWAGLALGTSLLYRSPLLFVPPLLALGFVFRKVRGGGGAARGLALAAVLPVLMLLPWMKLNYGLHGRPNPAEHMRSDTNIVSGALGLVANIEGDIRALAPEAEFEPGRVLGWAVRRVLSSPAAYARAVASRVVYAASFAPWLCLAALVAFWLGRREPALRAVSGLAAYFLGVHALMPIAPHYLMPLWMLLTVIVSVAAANLLAPKLTEDGVCRRFSRGLLYAGCAGAGALALAVLPRVARYDALGARAASPERLGEALSAAPADARLLGRRAEALRREGRPREAAVDLGRALARAPLDAETHVMLGYALALSGRPAVLEGLRLGAEATLKARGELPFYQAASEIRRGRPERARALLRGAVADWTATALTVNRLKTPLERETLAKLRPPGMTAVGGALLDPLSPSERIAYLAAVARAAPLEHVAEAAAVAGFLLLKERRAAEALPLLTRAVKANAAAVCSMSSESFGGPGRAGLPVVFFDECLERLPSNAKLWADRGVARAGRKDPRAEEDLRRSLALDPSSAEASLSLAFVLQGRGREREALEVVEAALARGGGGLRSRLIEAAAGLRRE